MAYTPGPWDIRAAQVLVDGERDYAVIDAHTNIIAECFGCSGVTTFHDALANARLIAAAPELLKVLQSILSVYEYTCASSLHQLDSDTLDDIRAVILTATRSPTNKDNS